MVTFTFIVLPETNGCVNSCVNSPEDWPVGPKRIEIHRYMNKIELVTSVGFSFHTLKRCTVQKALKNDVKDLCTPEQQPSIEVRIFVLSFTIFTINTISSPKHY